MGDHTTALCGRIDAVQAELRAIDAELQETVTADSAAVAALLHKLERIGSLSGMVLSKATHLAQDAQVRSSTGSSKLEDFFIDEVGLTPWEAQKRVRRAAFDYAPLPEEQAAIREARLIRERELTPPQETVDSLHYAVRSLKDPALAQELYAEALEQTLHRCGKDLKAWVNRRIHEANGAVVDPTGGWADRNLTIKKNRAGGKRIIIDAPDAEAAVIEAKLAKATRRSGPEDNRTYGQRLFDEAMKLLGGDSAPTNQDGLASLVISMSLKDVIDLPNLPADVTFPTNTDVELGPMDIYRLGVTKMGFAVVHDPNSGAAIHAGRFTRLATFWQRLMLFAEKLVCSHPNCDQPASRCQNHHILPYAAGGETEPGNLDQVCPRHHAENDDTRTHKGGKAYFDVDPVTGRKGLRLPDGTIALNNTVKQEKSGGHKIRNQPWPGEEPPPG